MNTTATIRPYGMLKMHVGGQNEIVVESGKTVRQVLLNFSILPEIVALVLVNDEQQTREYRI